MSDAPAEGNRDMVIELSCHKTPGRAVLSIEGWIEGNPDEILRLFMKGGAIELSDWDNRLQGSALIPKVNYGATRYKLLGNGAITVDGRELGAGDRVHIVTGGDIRWGR